MVTRLFVGEDLVLYSRGDGSRLEPNQREVEHRMGQDLVKIIDVKRPLLSYELLEWMLVRQLWRDLNGIEGWEPNIPEAGDTLRIKKLK